MSICLSPAYPFQNREKEMRENGKFSPRIVSSAWTVELVAACESLASSQNGIFSPNSSASCSLKRCCCMTDCVGTPKGVYSRADCGKQGIAAF